MISSTPTSRYSVGILFPQGNVINQDNDETVSIEEMQIGEENENDSIATEAETEDVVCQVKQRTFETDDTADENLDEEIGMSTQYMPSSMGITFIVKGSTDIIRGKALFATYRSARVTDCIIPFLPENPEIYKARQNLRHTSNMIIKQKL